MARVTRGRGAPAPRAKAVALVVCLVAAACVQVEADEPEPSPGGGGGGGACEDLSSTDRCTAQVPGACPDGEVCTLARTSSCGAAPCCTLPLSCEPVAGVAPGGHRCEDDADCASGVCLPLADGGVCFRPCRPATAGSTCPEELGCVDVALSETKSVRACVGVEDGAPTAARSLCRKDRDCAAGRYCRVFGGGRFVEGGAYGVCVPGARGDEAGLLCERDGPAAEPLRVAADASELCPDGGLCHEACADLDVDLCNCGVQRSEAACRGARCAKPCGSDAECPDRFVCRSPDLFRMTGPDPELVFQLCLMPDAIRTEWGCFDETDCCQNGVQRSGRPCCQSGQEGACEPDTLSETTHCRFEPDGTRFLTRCREPSGLAPLGGPCTAGDGCESGVCAPDGTCASPCVPGSDRCEELLPGSACCPTSAGDLCVPACRLDCATGPTCP